VKCHSLYNNVDITKEYDKHQLNKEASEVILEEGDILYYPAGIWHSVECLSEESISINFSIKQLRMADLISNVYCFLF
jgi:ribosomal protein L16 Arg81 hydroxylase